LQDSTSGKEQGRFVRRFVQELADPDLACVLEAWPTLPAPLRAAVMALVKTARQSSGC